MLQSQDWCEIYSLIDATRSRDDLRPVVSRAAAMLGFSFWAFGVRSRLPIESKVETVDDYPNGWMTHYMNSGFLETDTSISLAAGRNTIVTWADAAARDSTSLWSDAYEFGLRVGLAHPSWDRSGALGLLSLGRESCSLDLKEISSVSPHITWISALLNAKMSSFREQAFRPCAALSVRELDVLRWTAAGKTASEIATIMGITTRTVNFHIGNILQKLNSQNKIQASVRGLHMGLI